MNCRKSDGFTIIELMIGMIAMAIVAVTVGAMLVYSWTGWRRSTESIEMQRNAMVAITTLEKKIRNSADGTISGFGTQTLTFGDGSKFSASELSMGSFVNVDSFNAVTNELGGVVVSFKLSSVSGTDQNSYTITVYPRNE